VLLSDIAFPELPYRRLAHRPQWVSFAIHATLIALAFLAAFALRFDFALPAEYVDQLRIALPLLLVVRLLVFHQTGLFRAYWQHVGSRDLINLLTAVSVSSLLFVVVLFFAGRLDGMPRSVLIIDWVLVIFFCGGVRFATRYVWEARPRAQSGTGRRTLLIGAGAGAELLLRQTQHERDGDLFVIGMVDDDPSAQDRLLHGVPVLGLTHEIARLVTRFRIELLVITVQHATKDEMRDLVDRCAATGVEYKILPSLTELLSAPMAGGRLREVRIEDLLGRQPVQLDLAPVSRDVAGRTILITGAAGSIGSELARQLAGFRPARLILFERAESPLYFVTLEITRAYPELQVVPVIGDVTDRERVEQVFARFEPDYVFHAAAYKHVPMLETNVREAVRNNVFGTRQIVASAVRHNVNKVVLISTDKAVNPSSVMGATKRIAERILLSARLRTKQTTEFRIVRFGNVLGSDGSVIPLFRRQLSAGQPLTVTHPEVRRYFMTIPEAVQLVLQASLLPEAAGRVAMLEMGEPVRILYLAEQMIRLSGLVPYKDVPIVFTGLRPGEKLDEELTSDIEATIPTVVEKIRLVQTDVVDPDAVEHGLERLAAAVAVGRDHEVREALRAFVPEYRESAPHPPFADADVGIAGFELGVVDGGRRAREARVVASLTRTEHPGHGSVASAVRLPRLESTLPMAPAETRQTAAD
jgi:FlaA1/EpsC-like NDP-sugar epimerase